MAPDTISRRDWLKSLALGGGVGIAGCYARQGGDQAALLAPGGGGTSTTLHEGEITLVYATDYESVDVQQTPTIAWTSHGNRWVFGSDQSEVMVVAGIEFRTGAADYTEAKNLVDTYPTVVFTQHGNQYIFTE